MIHIIRKYITTFIVAVISSACITDTNQLTVSTKNVLKAQTNNSSSLSLSSLIPNNNVSGVLLDQNIIVQFNENIQAGSVPTSIDTIFIKKISDDSIVFQYSLDDTETSIATDTLTINPATDFTSLQSVYVEITSGTLSDTALNDFTGISGNSTWNFTTVNSSAPTISTLTPLDNATGIAINQTLSVQFNENIQAGSVPTSTDTIFIKKISDDSIVFQYSLDDTETSIATDTLTINPATDFASLESVYVEITSGTLSDTALNDFTGISGNSTWNFTTQDSAAPTISTLTPLDNATGIAINQTLSVQFNENIQAGSVPTSTDTIFIKKISDDSIVFQYSLDDTETSIATDTLTINPATDFASLESVYVEITSGTLSDTASNDYTGISGNSTWNFTTIVSSGPNIVFSIPSDNSNNIDDFTPIHIFFDDLIQVGSVAPSTDTIFIKKVSDNSVIFQYSLDDIEVNLSAMDISIFPASVLPLSTDIYVEVTAGAISNFTSNDFAGISGNTTLNFTTSNSSIPLALDFTPDDNTTLVPIYQSFSILFNESVQAGSIASSTDTIFIKKSSDDSVVFQYSLDDPEVLITGSSLTINPAADLPILETFYIEITPGAFSDSTSNDFPGISGNSAWNFTTANTPLNQEKITASDGAATDYFGESVSISGTSAIVGAPDDDDNGSRSGSAYIYTFDTSTST